MGTAELIAEGLSRMGLLVPPRGVATLAAHWTAVLDRSESLNLTSVRAEDGVTLHVLDSCTAASALMGAPEGRFADIGSGAGYPGIPLSVVTARPVDLIEATKKKAQFLQVVVGQLCLNATVRPVRAEELALEQSGAYSAITARAVAPLASLVELAAPLLVEGGSLVCLKGAPSREEVEAGDVAAGKCGMSRGELSPTHVPGLDARRALVVYTRTGEPSVRLPRRPGMAQRRPLA